MNIKIVRFLYFSSKKLLEGCNIVLYNFLKKKKRIEKSHITSYYKEKSLKISLKKQEF